MAQLHLRRRQPHRHGARRRHARRHVVGRRPQAPDAGHVHPAQAHLGEAGRQGDHEVRRRWTASARGRSRSSSSRRASSRASRPTRTTTAASRPSTASCCATSTTPTRWSPRSSAARSTPPRTSPAPPSTSSRRTRTSSPSQGNQGAMDEFAINGGAGLKKPHPALARPARAPGDRPRDRQEDDRQPRARRPGHAGRRAERLAQPRVDARDPRRPAATTSTSTRPTRSSTTAGYKDTNGDGIREMPGGGRPLKFRYAVRSEGDAGPPTAEFITRLAAQDRDRDHAEGLRRQPADRGHRQGRLRPLRVGLDAVRRPRSDALVLHLRPGQQGPQGPDELLQRRELVRPAVRRALQAAEGRARPGQARATSSTRCSRASTSRPSYDVLYTYPDLQAYRKDRFTGWIRQPEKTGPVLFSNSSPTYATPEAVVAGTGAGAGGGDGGGGSGGLIAIIVVAVVVLGAGGAVGRCAGAPPTSASERPLRHRQGPRVAGDACLRRRLQLLPLPRRRGRPGRQPLPRAQPQPEPARRAHQAVRPRRLHRRSSSSPTSSRPRSSTSGARTPTTSRSRRRSGARRGRPSRSSASRRCSRRSSA